MAIRKELMATSDGPLTGPDGLSKELMKALVERMMAGELNHHLGYEKHEVTGYGAATRATGRAGRLSKRNREKSPFKCPGIGKAPSSRRLSRSTRPALKDSMRRSSRCMHWA